MKPVDLTNVKEAGDYSRPEAGAYICNIVNVVDIPLNQETNKGDYLKIIYDIAEGEYKGYYDEMRTNHPDWISAGSYIRSYKPAALGMFKRFCSAVSKSNPGYIFDGNTHADESTLKGKKIGLVFQEEEYYGNDGNKKTRLIVNKEFPVDEIAKQKVPAVKKLKEETPSDDGFMTVTESGDLPFNS